jgi:hypothetical protein
LNKTLEQLQPTDFDKQVLIRNEPHTIVQAINRQMTHYAYHIGQIVFLAKHFRSSAWQSLSIPRNRSAGFNEYLKSKVEAGATEHRFDAAAGFAQSTDSDGQ